MRTVAVTGARGMIGSIITRKLVNAGFYVKLLTRTNLKYFSQRNKSVTKRK